MDKVIAQARELGKTLQQEEAFVRFLKAQKANEADVELQEKMTEFENKRLEITQEVQKEDDKDAELIKRLDKELKQIYSDLTQSQSLIDLAEAQAEVQEMVTGIIRIVQGSAQGINPDYIDITCPPEGCSSCSGNC